MKNAEKFRKIFREFATEVWAFPEKDFLKWLNAEYKEPTTRNCFGCKYSKDNHNSGTEECHLCMWENQYTPTTKNDLAHNLCDSCTNIGCEFQSGIIRTECAFYMPPHIEPDNCGNYVVQDSTTKNDLGVDCNNCKNNLYKGDGITYCATDDGMCHFESKTEDYISRDAVKYYIQEHIHEIITESGIDKNAHTNGVLRSLLNGVDTMPSVTPQLSVPEVTALAEWTEKLTKASEDAYNKGFADGVKSVNICPHCGEYIGEEE